MREVLSRVVLEKFVKGKITSVPPYRLPVGGCTGVSNFWYKDDRLVKRPAPSSLGGVVDDNVVGFYEYRLLSGATKLCLFTLKDVYYYSSGWSQVTADVFTSGVDDHIAATTFTDTLIVTNGKDHVKKWTGTGAVGDLIGGDGYQTPVFHIAKQVINYKNRIALFHTTEDSVLCPQRFRFSDVGTIEDWTSANFFDLQDKPDAIVKALRLSQKLVIYKDSSVVLCMYVGGEQIFDFATAVESTGLLAPRSLKAVTTPRGDVHIFLSRGGVMMYDGGSYVIPVSKSIEEELMLDTAFQYASRAFAVVYPRHSLYVLFMPGSDGEMKKAYVFNYWQRGWSVWDFASAYTGGWEYGGEGTNWVPSEARTNLLGRGVQAEELNLGGTTEWDGEATWESKNLELSPKGRNNYFTVKYVLVEAKGNDGGEVLLDYSIDEGVSWDNIGTVTLTDSWGWHKVEATQVTAKSLRVRLKQASGADGWVEVRRAEVYFDASRGSH